MIIIDRPRAGAGPDCEKGQYSRSAGDFQSPWRPNRFLSGGAGGLAASTRELALERVWKMLDEARGRQWRVNSSHGISRRSYLLIESVVLSVNLDDSVSSP